MIRCKKVCNIDWGEKCLWWKLYRKPPPASPNEPQHDKTNKMASGPCKDSGQPGHSPSLIRVFAVRSVDSFLHADSEDSDQTGWMLRLIRVFAGRTVILLVLSWGGSNDSTLLSFSLQLSSDTIFSPINIWKVIMKNLPLFLPFYQYCSRSCLTMIAGAGMANKLLKQTHTKKLLIQIFEIFNHF